MKRIRFIFLGFLLFSLDAKAVTMTKDKIKILEINYKRSRTPTNFPSSIEETYLLAKAGTILMYSVYYTNMPIQLNHNDSAEMNTKKLGKKIIDLALKFDLKKYQQTDADSAIAMDQYKINFKFKNMDYTAVIDKVKASNEWSSLNKVFTDLILVFEKESGRPLLPSKLN